MEADPKRLAFFHSRVLKNVAWSPINAEYARTSVYDYTGKIFRIALIVAFAICQLGEECFYDSVYRAGWTK
jgi:hypothetical protein